MEDEACLVSCMLGFGLQGFGVTPLSALSPRSQARQTQLARSAAKRAVLSPLHTVYRGRLLLGAIRQGDMGLCYSCVDNASVEVIERVRLAPAFLSKCLGRRLAYVLYQKERLNVAHIPHNAYAPVPCR